MDRTTLKHGNEDTSHAPALLAQQKQIATHELVNTAHRPRTDPFSTPFLSTLAVCPIAFLTDAPYALKLFQSAALVYTGLAASAAGLAGFVWAKVTLGPQYSPCFDSLIPQRIVTTGPYTYIRHPIYASNIVSLLGLFLATGSAWLLLNAVLVAAYYVRSAHNEDRVLAQEFQEYKNYSLQTGAFLPTLFRHPRSVEAAQKREIDATKVRSHE